MHANIWIRKENEERWKAIKDKSAWVNAYLEKSPPNSRVLEQRLEEPGTVVGRRLKTKLSTQDILEKTNRYMSDLKLPVCKVHATPLDERGRCLQKGCKYA